MLDTSENGGLGSLSRVVLLDIVFRCYEEAQRVSAFRSRRPHFGAEAICRFRRLGCRRAERQFMHIKAQRPLRLRAIDRRANAVADAGSRCQPGAQCFAGIGNFALTASIA
jgi:hypothetical protein